MRARKRFGQHFLHHKTILNRIADALFADPPLPPPGSPVPPPGSPVPPPGSPVPPPGSPVPPPGSPDSLLPATCSLLPATCYLTIEIGPGQGAFTRVLAERGARVVAIEKDRDLARLVEQSCPSVRVVTGDALELDWRRAAGAGPDEPLLVTGNIPYNITSPLLARALQTPRPLRIVFLVQEEVADRLAAPPGDKTYGALTVGVRAVARVEKLFRVPAGAFHPRPKVDSAVVRLIPLAEPLVAETETLPLRRLVVGLFGFRRKQLSRGLRELTGWPPEQVAALLEQLGLDPAARPEVLATEDFVRLLRGLIDAGWTHG